MTFPWTRPEVPLILLCTLCMLVLSCGCADDAGVVQGETGAEGAIRGVTVPEAVFLIEKYQGDDTFVILDVRRPDEYAGGAIGGAVNLDYSDPDFPEQAGLLDRERTYLVYCRSGGRSGSASRILETLGFVRVYDLEGGIEAWQAAGYPVVIPETETNLPGA